MKTPELLRFTAVLIPTLEEQRLAGETNLVVPAGVKIPDLPMPLFRDSSYNVPKDVIGFVNRIWVEDGRLLAEVELGGLTMGWAGTVDETGEDGVAKRFGLMSVSVVPIPSWMGGRIV